MCNWHPILAAAETAPGIWHMTDATGKQYAIVRLLERDGELGYRAVTWAEQSEDRWLIGYYTNLRAATIAAHMRFIGEHGKTGPVNGR